MTPVQRKQVEDEAADRNWQRLKEVARRTWKPRVTVLTVKEETPMAGNLVWWDVRDRQWHGCREGVTWWFLP